MSLPPGIKASKTTVTYGQQRHFEIDAVVGHNDSAANPSHFTAENDNGQIIVIELPGGNVVKGKDLPD